MSACFDDLPDELLEHIMSIVSPYHDLNNCKVVSKKWYNAMKRVVRRKQCNFSNALKTSNLKWDYGQCAGISNRHSHAACCHDGYMYVYGGFSKTSTSFNDLTALDLSKRTWKRIISAGHFPSPKAGASLCGYKNKLVLYGGCAQPSSMCPFQPLIIFGELHVFDIETKFWTTRLSAPKPPTTNHSVSVHRNVMVTFGGLRSQEGSRLDVSNCVHCLDLDTWVWTSPRVSSMKPPPLFGTSQIYLDDDHLVIIGGRDKSGYPCQGAWLLTMGEEPWQWRSLISDNPQWTPPRLWYHPVVKVGPSLIAFSRCHEEKQISDAREPVEEANIRQEPEENVNGRRGNFQRNRGELEHPIPAGPAHSLSRVQRRKQQLALLDKYQKKYSKEKLPEVESLPSMNLYVADMSDVVATGVISWQEPRYSPGCPSDRILYTLLLGNSELIMLGGLVANQPSDEKQEFELVDINALAFARAPRFSL